MSKGNPAVPTATLVALYESGMTFRAIGERYGVSFQTLAEQYKNAGYTARPKSQKKYFPIPCPTCKEHFTPRSRRQVWCSPKCIRHTKVTHCKRGHRLDGDNLYVNKRDQSTRCRKCVQIRQRQYYRRKTQEQSHE